MLPNPIIWNIHMYGIMVAVGLLAAFIVLSVYCKRMQIGIKLSDFLYYNGIASILVGFGSAALFQATYDYIENPENGFSFDGGITFIGGLIGGAGFFLLIYFLLRKKLDGKLTDVISIIPCAITVAHSLGRVGCFFAGCCYGKETESIFGVQFPHLHTRVHPTQLYEAAFLLVLFIICSVLLLKWKFRHNLSVYLVTYGIFRFLLEFLRGDDRGQLLGIISPSQFWSLLMIVIGIACVPLMNYFIRRSNVITFASTVDTVQESVADEEENNEEIE